MMENHWIVDTKILTPWSCPMCGDNPQTPLTHRWISPVSLLDKCDTVRCHSGFAQGACRWQISKRPSACKGGRVNIPKRCSAIEKRANLPKRRFVMEQMCFQHARKDVSRQELCRQHAKTRFAIEKRAVNIPKRRLAIEKNMSSRCNVELTK